MTLHSAHWLTFSPAFALAYMHFVGVRRASTQHRTELGDSQFSSQSAKSAKFIFSRLEFQA